MIAQASLDRGTRLTRSFDRSPAVRASFARMGIHGVNPGLYDNTPENEKCIARRKRFLCPMGCKT
ncbi:MAG: hypothetical protein M1546_25545 [Chloroflexi bacterium]|nr:hypothetical protein [Chloroflexota bacterium]